MFAIIKVNLENHPSVILKGEKKDDVINSFAKMFCDHYGYSVDAEECEDIINVIIDNLSRTSYFNDFEAIDGEGDAIYYLVEV